MKTLLAAIIPLLFASAAMASPILKSEVVVNSSIVTVGDMFDGADLLAEKALFRSPAPGTSGQVSLDAIRIAAAKIGLTDYRPPESGAVIVVRYGQEVDAPLLGSLIEDSLRQKGFLRDGVSADINFSGPLPLLTADNSVTPVSLVSLRYSGGSGAFAARFTVSGQSEPVDVTGRADLVVAVPHLVGALSSNSIIRPENVEMRNVLVRQADTGSFSSLDQVIGMQLKRPARAGKMLQPDDLKTPAIVSRNETVTIVYRSGPMTLTVKGQALSDAAAGEPVQVLNLLSSKVLSAIASEPGMVIISDPSAEATAVR